MTGSSPASALYDASVAAMALEIDPPKDDDEALTLLPSAAAKASSSARAGPNVSAVYRWYEIEEGFSAKRREESSIARCKLCRQQGKLERKACVRFSKSVTSNLWRHLKENHPQVYEKHASEKKSVQMHRVAGANKRGRKKKVLSPAEDKMAEEGQKAAKKTKRSEHQTQLFPEYQPLQQTAVGAGAVLAGNFNPEKVREAMGYLCLYEMLPFELCSSHAFRNLMVECSGGAGGYVDDSNSFALFAKEIAFGYAKKMSAEVKVRTVMQMKMTDFAHLMISEWRPSNCAGENHSLERGSASFCGNSNNGGTSFLALFAVGLDPEFNPFRRCLHVSSIEAHHTSSGDLIAAELARDKELSRAMMRVTPGRYMPQLLAIEPPCNEYQAFCAIHKLKFLESVPTLLQNIMLATINEVTVSGNFCLGTPALTISGESASVGIHNRRLDKGEYVESSSAAVVAGSAGDNLYILPSDEIASNILEELPASLTGHTYRDLMNKVMHLMAHFKQSAASRKVLRKCSMNADAFERVFINRLRDLVISAGGIYYVLSLVEDMNVALKKYFALHKDGISDFSKLIQLSSLSRYEWSRVGYLKTLLKPFADATTKLDGEKHFVSSLIVPSISTLLEKLQHPQSTCSGFADKSNGSKEPAGELPEDIEALRELAHANLSGCFGHLFTVPEVSWGVEKRDTFNLLWSATILDPRTRPFIIKGPLSQQEFWEVVKAEAANIAGTKKKDKENSSDLGENAISLDEEDGHLDGNGVGKSSDLWDDLQANLASCAQEEMLLSSSKSSLEITKSSNLLEVEVSFFQEEGSIPLRANPLEWWQNMRMKYPFLARLARYVLSIPCNVKVNDNPIRCDGGLVKRAPCEMSLPDLCDLLAASMNLRTEKNAHFEAASKQMWSTV